MDYGMIGKREKAKRYAEEQNRFLLNKFDVTFHGDNNNQSNPKPTIESIIGYPPYSGG